MTKDEREFMEDFVDRQFKALQAIERIFDFHSKQATVARSMWAGARELKDMMKEYESTAVHARVEHNAQKKENEK